MLDEDVEKKSTGIVSPPTEPNGAFDGDMMLERKIEKLKKKHQKKQMKDLYKDGYRMSVDNTMMIRETDDMIQIKF